VKVYVDTREPKQNHQFLATAFPNIEYELRALPEGDYATDKVIIERKTITDLYGSIVGSKDKPGRLLSQISRLSCHDKVVVLLIIGNIAAFIDNMKRLNVRVDVGIIYGALASLSCREHIHVIWVQEEWDGLITMVKFMQKVEDGNYKWPSRRDPIILMARYLKITPQQMQKLKDKFESIGNIVAASDKELMAIEGIGKTKARNIRELLTNGW